MVHKGSDTNDVTVTKTVEQNKHIWVVLISGHSKYLEKFQLHFFHGQNFHFLYVKTKLIFASCVCVFMCGVCCIFSLGKLM